MMLTLRFAGAFWLVYATIVLRPSFTEPGLKAVLESFPHLALAALTLGVLPGVVAVASIVRWLRARPSERCGPFGTATRLAALLSLVGLILPLHAADAAAAATELGYRAGQLVALLLVLDGPIAPAAD